MTTRRFYANAAPQQTLTGPITNSATSLTVAGSFAGWPSSFPYFACLEYGTASMEIVSVTAVVGTTATIVRAQDGTSGISHLGGATLDQVAIRQDFDEASAHTSANSGVHGRSGNVVGDTDAQTLTNKTLTTPTVNGAALAGTLSGSPAFSGAPSFSGSPTFSGLPVMSNGLNVTGKYIRFPTFTTEAAATAAIGAPVAGEQVWLSAPAGNGGTPGLFYYDGTAWTSLVTPHVHGSLIQATTFGDLTSGSYTDILTMSPAINIPLWAQDGTHKIVTHCVLNPSIITASGGFLLRPAIGANVSDESAVYRVEAAGNTDQYAIDVAGTFTIGAAVATVTPKVQGLRVVGTAALRLNNASNSCLAVWSWIIQ